MKTIRTLSEEMDGILISSILKTLENTKDTVVTAETEGRAHRHADLAVDTDVRRVVEVELRIRILVVDRRRAVTLLDRESRERRFDGAGRAEAVTVERLRGGDVDLLRLLFTEHALNIQSTWFIRCLNDYYFTTFNCGMTHRN